jgi:hypothetical protein
MQRQAVWGHALSYYRMIFLPLTFATWSTMKILECLKVMCSVDGFLSWPNLTNKHSLALQKTVYMVRQMQGIVLTSFSWAMLHDTIPCFCYVVPGLKWRNQLLSPIMMLWRNSAFSSILLQLVQGNFLLMFVLQQKVMSSADTNFPIFQTFHHPLDHMVSYVNFCWHFPVTCPSSLMRSLIFPSFLLVEAVLGQPLHVVRRCLYSCLWKGLPIPCHC